MNRPAKGFYKQTGDQVNCLEKWIATTDNKRNRKISPNFGGVIPQPDRHVNYPPWLTLRRFLIEKNVETRLGVSLQIYKFICLLKYNLTFLHINLNLLSFFNLTFNNLQSQIIKNLRLNHPFKWSGSKLGVKAFFSQIFA